ncbi:hypothetical protein A4A49_18749 [Nicotiana attenuata]|uniref:Uncharacterized protein n=1 Tax=Nicotiana attenuata TaxID=49451 RepID=A0A1J6LBD2_NICAT|nr:hypothetical protein A4A49_18749 [Nicotiana attenuata]
MNKAENCKSIGLNKATIPELKHQNCKLEHRIDLAEHISLNLKMLQNRKPWTANLDGASPKMLKSGRNRRINIFFKKSLD